MDTIISRLTMKRKKHLFYDKVDFNPVCLYEDKYGQKWMANDPFRFWSFRVKHELNKSE